MGEHTSPQTEREVATRRYDRPLMHPRIVWSGGFIRPGGKRASDLCKHSHLTEQDARDCAERRLVSMGIEGACVCPPDRIHPLHMHDCPARPVHAENDPRLRLPPGLNGAPMGEHRTPQTANNAHLMVSSRGTVHVVRWIDGGPVAACGAGTQDLSWTVRVLPGERRCSKCLPLFPPNSTGATHA